MDEAQNSGNSFCMFEIGLKNTGEESRSVLGIMAVYDASGKICDIVQMSYRLEAQASGCLGMGTFLPAEAKQSKLYIWDMHDKNMIPVLHNKIFHITHPPAEAE